MIDQDTNGEIDEQEATFAINYIFGEPVEPMPEVQNDLMTDSK